MDLLNLDLWEQQWEALVSAPYVIVSFTVVAGLIGWWLRGLRSGRKIDSLKGRVEVSEDRLKLAAEKVVSANQARDDVERQFEIYKAEVTANSGTELAAIAAKVDVALARFSAASNAVGSAIGIAGRASAVSGMSVSLTPLP